MEKKVYLIGELSDNFTGRKLPTNGEVMSVFLYQHNQLKLTLKHSAVVTVKKAEEKWLQAGLSICKNYQAVQKVLKLFKNWLKLKKNQHRKKSVAQKKRETQFLAGCGKLFDLTQSNLMQKLDDNKKLFLNAQKSDKRYGFIDTSVSNEIASQVTMDIDVDDLNQPAASSSNVLSGAALSRNQSTTATDTTCSQQSEINSEYEIPPSYQAAPPKTDVITPELASALDRANVSNRNSTFILSAAYKSVGLDIEKLNLSCSTIRRNRIRYRQTISESLKDEFKFEDRYTVHWDGKILSDITFSDSVDRIAIILSTSKMNQLLGVPKILDGSAESHSVAIIDTLKEWKVSPHIKAMCFDTPAVNTGLHNGTAAIIERKLNRKLIWLPCRHHIFEIILKAVFEVFWKTTSGPNIPIFKRFQSFWDKIDKSKYEIGIKDEVVAKAVEADRLELINFITHHLTISQPRNDYKELLELSLIFLGGSLGYTTDFKRPGAMHHARWMAKAIYSLKIYLFRNQFPLTNYEMNSLQQVCIFIISIYIKVWFTSPSAIQAPNNDLLLIKKLLLDKNIKLSIAQIALKKMCDHLWYLNEDLAASALFDINVSDETKQKMCEAIKNQESTIISKKRYVTRGIELESFLNKGLSDFVSKKSLTLFETFDLPNDFLEINITLWPNNESYKENVKFFKDLTVVNDVAERGIALIEEYNNCLTKNEEQLQYLLQVVQEHRRRFPDCNKKTLK